MMVIDSLMGNNYMSLNFVLGDGFSHWVTVVYGPNNSKEGCFRNELGAVGGFYSGCWCMDGDFNIPRSPSEKYSGGCITKSMQNFSNLIDDPNLLDIPLTNGK